CWAGSAPCRAPSPEAFSSASSNRSAPSTFPSPTRTPSASSCFSSSCSSARPGSSAWASHDARIRRRRCPRAGPPPPPSDVEPLSPPPRHHRAPLDTAGRGVESPRRLRGTGLLRALDVLWRRRLHHHDSLSQGRARAVVRHGPGRHGGRAGLVAHRPDLLPAPWALLLALDARGGGDREA